MALKAAGYEAAKGGGAHQRTIDSLKLTIGDDGTVVNPLQKFRAKRDGGIYETTGIASETEIAELRSLAASLQARVLRWLKSTHENLLPPKLGIARRTGKSQGDRRPKRPD